jgi:CYTH domain-containing protein
MNAEAIKYSRIEYERRFLVSPNADWKKFIEPYSKTFEDKYLQDSRLRLRILTDSDTNRRLIKLTKKIESDSPYFQMITTTILSPDEYQLLDALEGNRLTKTRYYHNYRNQIFSIDVFGGELKDLILCETERESLEDLMSAEFPVYAKYEVTRDDFFTGGNLCRKMRAELLLKLSAFE